jgi:NADP-dependent 3-hydroxy acid dehydrogenase YdfG
VLNAGVYDGGFPSELSQTDWATQLQLNFGQAQQTLEPLLSGLKTRKSGKIILIGTVVTREPRTFAASYTLSKGLLDQYGRLLADELRGYNVALTRILPGSVNTETWGDADVPRECFVEPDDIAGTVEFVLNQRAPVWIEEIVVRPLDKNW